jgi:hypothetical protein
MDETYFTDKIVLLLVINLKTTAVIGSCIAKSTEDDQKAYIYASVKKRFRSQSAHIRSHRSKTRVPKTKYLRFFCSISNFS